MSVAHRVVVVEDNEATRTAIDRSLRRLGYEVFLARDGEEGLALALTFKPEVILTDLRMPRMDGHTLIRRLVRQGTDAAVVVMSAEGDVNDLVQVLRNGAVDYLSKPWTASDLIAAISRAVEIHARRRTAFVPHLATVSAAPDGGAVASAPPRALPHDALILSDTELEQLRDRARRSAFTTPDDMPGLPELRGQLRGHSARGETLTALVERQPTLAEGVLRVANSAAYSTLRPHRDTPSAIEALGVHALQNVVETLFVHDGYQVADVRLAALRARIARFSMARALSMRALAEIASDGGRVDPERAYRCGLLADVGATFMVWQLGERTVDGTPAAWSDDDLTRLVETQHEELGEILLSRWGFDAEVAVVARVHHAGAPPAPPTPYWSLAVLGGQLASQVQIGRDATSPGEPDPIVLERCAAELRIGMIAVYRMRDSVRAEYESLLEALSA